MAQRVTGMDVPGQKSFPCVSPIFKFAQHGQSGTWLSELLPATRPGNRRWMLRFVKSVNTEAINHDPAITFINTGAQQPGPAEHWLMAQAMGLAMRIRICPRSS